MIRYGHILLCIVAVCAFVLTGCASTRRMASPDVLRLANLNIDHATGIDGRTDLKRIARLLKTIEADVVTLQGVDRWADRSDRVDQIVSLAESLERTYTYSHVRRLESGETGNGLLTRFPIIEERHVESDSVRGLAGFMLVVLERGGQELVIVNTDLGGRGSPFRLDVTLEEIEQSTERFSTAPLVICGFDAKYAGEDVSPSDETPSGKRWMEITSDSRDLHRGFVLIDRRSIESQRVVISSAQTMVTDGSRYQPMVVEFRIKTD